MGSPVDWVRLNFHRVCLLRADSGTTSKWGISVLTRKDTPGFNRSSDAIPEQFTLTVLYDDKSNFIIHLHRERLIDWLIKLYFSTVKILALQRPTHISAVATVLPITKTLTVKELVAVQWLPSCPHDITWYPRGGPMTIFCLKLCRVKLSGRTFVVSKLYLSK